MSQFKDFHINPDGAPEITAETLMSVLPDHEIQLVDVRRPDEFTGELGHIEGSQLITLETELESRMTELDSQKTTVFICRSGQRSTAATHLAQERGFEHVYNLQGGMLKWNALGFPKVS